MLSCYNFISLSIDKSNWYNCFWHIMIDGRGDIFGEIYLYMQKEQYNMYAIVQEKAKILEFDSNLFSIKEGKLDPSHMIVFQNILMLFAQKAFHMILKLQVLNSGNLRHCLIRFLLNLQQAAIQ
jgi:hypothetical protein